MIDNTVTYHELILDDFGRQYNRAINILFDKYKFYDSFRLADV